MSEVPAHKGIILAYKIAMGAYTEMNNDFSEMADWAQNLLPLSNMQKQVTEERMEQVQKLFDINSDQASGQDQLWVTEAQHGTQGGTSLEALGITDPYVCQLIVPNGTSVTIDSLSTVHTYYSSAASAVTAAGNAADQTFGNITQGAMGVVTNGTSSMTTLASMLQAFVQTISSSTVKL
jgi:hypothetical protein